MLTLIRDLSLALLYIVLRFFPRFILIPSNFTEKGGWSVTIYNFNGVIAYIARPEYHTQLAKHEFR